MSDTKRPGRPPLDANDDSTSVSLKVPAKLYEQVCQLADRQRIKPPELIRRAMRREVEAPDVSQQKGMTDG